MAMVAPRIRTWSVGLAAALGLVLFVSRGSLGQQPKGPPAEKGKTGPTKLYYGVDACRNCHTKGTDLKTAVCRCTEVAIWEEHDKHALANKLLKEERAQQMGKLLKIKDVANDKLCITCHGVFVEEGKIKDGSFKLAEGVSCVACHGAYADWVKEHFPIFGGENAKWRARTREDKETNFGMTDLWHPDKRAKLCLSCHVGNTREGKVVTHDMYAAGHPPLPSVELATFSDEMPKHWEYLAEKKPTVQKQLNYYDANEAAVEQTRLVLVSGLASFRASVRLLGTEAEAADKEDPWPELAQFDCYACHHDLKNPAWRQKRGYIGRPGRPQMREWPNAMVRVALRVLGQDDRILATKLKPLHDVFEATPFGKPKEVAEAAKVLSRWSDDEIKKLYDKKLDRAGLLNVLRTIVGLAASETFDYDSARQLAWAANIVSRELFHFDKTKSANQENIKKKFDELDLQLKLKLPAGKEHSIIKEMSLNLKKIGDYTPGAFKQTMGELLLALPKS